ncbi:MAG TPA: hypothetical protein VFV43_00080 [Limnobacter sp.]|nr:hypothetical protein [Limnobacter sp.]
MSVPNGRADTTGGSAAQQPRPINKAVAKLWENIPPRQLKDAIAHMSELTAQLRSIQIDKELMLDVIENINLLEHAARASGLLSSQGAEDAFFNSKLDLHMTPQLIQKAVDTFNQEAKRAQHDLTQA